MQFGLNIFIIYVSAKQSKAKQSKAKQSKAKQSIIYLIIISVTGCILLYVAYRSYNLSFTHDEAHTFKILLGDRHVANTANNHLLNTWLATLFYHVFGSSEFVLRLPNLLAFILFAFFVSRYLSGLRSIMLTVIGVSVLMLNHYMLDFFSLARGYGLALAFEFAALCILLQRNKDENFRSLALRTGLALLFSLAAALANLSFLNLNIAMVFIVLLEILHINRKRSIQLRMKHYLVFAGMLLINFIAFYFLVQQLLFLFHHNELYIGGKDSLIDSTLTILIHRSIYLSYYGEYFWMYLRLGVIGVIVIAFLSRLFGTKYTGLSRMIIILSILISATVFQHYLYDTLYPTERASLVFLPVFSFILFLLIMETGEQIRNLKIRLPFYALVILIISSPIVYHFGKNLNYQYTLEWRNDAHNRELMRYIENDLKDYSGEEKVRIAADWYYEPVINYYRISMRIAHLDSITRTDQTEGAKYLYFKNQNLPDSVVRGQYKTIMKFDDIQTTFWMKMP